MIMFCSKCGKQLNDEDVFCSGCGTQVGAPTTSSLPSQPVEPQFKATLNGVEFDLVQLEQLGKLFKNPRAFNDIAKYVRAKSKASVWDSASFVNKYIVYNSELKAYMDTVYAQQELDFQAKAIELKASNTIHCPKCLSQRFDIQKKGFSLGKSVLGIVGFGPLGAVAGAHKSNNRKYKCLDCGHEWKD